MSDSRILAAGNSVYRAAHPAIVAENEPIILLTLSHSGAEILSDLLSGFPSVVCTSRTGLVPMCEAAAATWQRVERRTRLSPLAISSIRALATLMICVLTTDSGGLRWCETAILRPGSRRGFLRQSTNCTPDSATRRCSSLKALARLGADGYRRRDGLRRRSARSRPVPNGLSCTR